MVMLLLLFVCKKGWLLLLPLSFLLISISRASKAACAAAVVCVCVRVNPCPCEAAAAAAAREYACVALFSHTQSGGSKKSPRMPWDGVG
jgi:hypothetical protein